MQAEIETQNFVVEHERLGFLQAVRDVMESLQLLDVARVPVNERPQLLIQIDRDF